MDSLLIYINFFGTLAFSISGALTAMKKHLDPFGVFILAFVTSVGGGTIRDALISNRTAFWLTDPIYFYLILVGTVIAILFRQKLDYLRNTLMLFDSAGLGLFTIVGVEIACQQGLSFYACVALGTVTGVFGGVVRDILANEVPVIFRKEIYATITIAGGALYWLLRTMNAERAVLQILPILLIVALRVLAVYYKWSLPSLKLDSKSG